MYTYGAIKEFLASLDMKAIRLGAIFYYVRVKGWVGGIAKYLLFLTLGGRFWIILT